MKTILVAALILGLAGCTSAPKKNAKLTPGGTTSTTSSNPFLSSSKKVQQDLTQTETDLGQLESQTKFSK